LAWVARNYKNLPFFGNTFRFYRHALILSKWQLKNTGLFQSLSKDIKMEIKFPLETPQPTGNAFQLQKGNQN
jgi:hypothetical protein